MWCAKHSGQRAGSPVILILPLFLSVHAGQRSFHTWFTAVSTPPQVRCFIYFFSYGYILHNISHQVYTEFSDLTFYLVEIYFSYISAIETKRHISINTSQIVVIIIMSWLNWLFSGEVRLNSCQHNSILLMLHHKSTNYITLMHTCDSSNQLLTNQPDAVAIATIYYCLFGAYDANVVPHIFATTLCLLHSRHFLPDISRFILCMSTVN